MKLVQSLAADYWLENSEQIYKEDLHVSTPVMEAYEAGFRKAIELCLSHGEIRFPNIADRDDGFGPSLHDQVMAEDFFVYDELGYLGRFFRWAINLFK
jgi:hypothetical protein